MGSYKTTAPQGEVVGPDDLNAVRVPRLGTNKNSGDVRNGFRGREQHVTDVGGYGEFADQFPA